MSKVANGNSGSNGKGQSHNSHDSHNSQSLILPPRGDYHTLLSYQKSEVIYQITYRFCELAQSFLKDGGLRERMTSARPQARDRQKKGRGLG